jgi:hypothetical protein
MRYKCLIVEEEFKEFKEFEEFRSKGVQGPPRSTHPNQLH